MTTTINNEHKKLNVPNKREQNQTCLDSAEREGLRPKGNVPNLRFPEFQGEWEKCRLGDVCTFLSGGTPKIDVKEYWNGTIPFVSAISMHDTYILDSKLHISEEGLKHGSRLLTKNNLLLLVRGSMLWNTIPICLNKNDVAFNQDVKGIIANDTINNEFLLYWLKSKEQRLKYMVTGTGLGAGKLDTSDLLSMIIYIPAMKEQDKVARLLSLFDERIATQNKIIEDLKKLKSAIVEKVFCSPNQEYPMCRIEGFEQSLSTYKMSDFSSRIATKNKDSKCSLVLTIAAQYGLVNQESFFNKSVASENLTGYYLLHKGEFAYNRSYSAGYDWGTVKRLDNYDEGVLSTLYICFKINETIVDSDYLAYYFESTKWHRGLSDIAGEGARNHGLLNVSMADYFNTKHRFPVIEEQKAIAKILNAITEKERKATLLGECYQKQKQYLLCQMFT